MSNTKKNLEDDYYFIRDINNLLNDKIEAFVISGNSYVRKKVYEYCEKKNLKTTRAKGKVVVVVCKEHKCICFNRTPLEYRCHHTYGSERCLDCDYTCPKYYCDDDYYCDFREVCSKLPIIYIHKKNIPIEKLRKLDSYPRTIDLY